MTSFSAINYLQFAPGRYDSGNACTASWEEFCALLSEATTGAKASAGAILPGTSRNGHRTAADITSRSAVVLDYDGAPADFAEQWRARCKWASVIHTTASHDPGRSVYKWRAVIPLARPIENAATFFAVSDAVAAQIGIDGLDRSTHQWNRLFYLPTSDSEAGRAEFRHFVVSGDMLDAADVTMDTDRDTLPDVTDARAPGYERTKTDPAQLPGLVGAFCAVYDIPAAIAEFLPHVYVPYVGGRYTYVPGSTVGGLHVTAEGVWAYSHHSTDPARDHWRNAYDLVRIHLYGHKDVKAQHGTPVDALPSSRAMAAEFGDTAKHPRIAEAMTAAAARRIADDFADIAGTDGDDGDNSAWLSTLDCAGGRILNTRRNLYTIITHDPRTRTIKYNEHAYCDEVQGAYFPVDPDRVADEATCERVATYIETTYPGTKVNGKRVASLLCESRPTRAYNPLREYLDALSWDGVERIGSLLPALLGADDNDYTRAVMRKWMAAAVARVYEPGCKFDHVLTLCGRQGTGKSTFLRLLSVSEKYFSDRLPLDGSGKDRIELLRGKHIIEIGEMTGARRAETAAIKQFLSATSDTLRAAYAYMTSSRPRCCVFAATTNEFAFLRDAAAGNRRFWVVDVPGGLPVKEMAAYLERNRAQLWAEAVALYRAGEALYLDESTAAQARRAELEHSDTADDPLRDDVERYLETPRPPHFMTSDAALRAAMMDNDGQPGAQWETIDRVCTQMLQSDIRRWAAVTDGRWLRRRLADIMATMDGWDAVPRGVRVYGLPPDVCTPGRKTKQAGGNDIYVRQGVDPTARPRTPAEEDDI